MGISNFDRVFMASFVKVRISSRWRIQTRKILHAIVRRKIESFQTKTKKWCQKMLIFGREIFGYQKV